LSETILFDQNENESDNSLGYEVFMSEGDTIETEDGLIWKEVLREGTWSYRPGPGHKPLAKPLSIVAGNSTNEDEIGMADLIDAFEDNAIDHITVPTSHDDKPHENTGYVRKLQQGVRNGRKVLMAGLEFTEPDIKEKAIRGSIANTSAGIIAGYINKLTGKTYKYALGHIALTNKPWISGMTPFGANSNFSEDNIIPVAIELSSYMDGEDSQSEEGMAAEFLDELLMAFMDKDSEKLADIFSAFEGKWPSAWDRPISEMLYEGREDDLNTLRKIVDELKGAKSETFDKDFFERMLSSMDFSEENFGESSDNESHENEEEDDSSEDEGADSSASKDDEDKKGGNDMSESSTESVESDKTELSEDVTTDLLNEHKAEFSEQLAERDAEIEKLRSEVHENKVDKSIEDLKALGFSEFPGFLKAVRDIYLADVKEASIITLSEEDGSSVELSASEIVDRIIKSLPTEELFKHSFSDNITSMDDHGRPDVGLSDNERGERLAEHLGIELPKDGDN